MTLEKQPYSPVILPNSSLCCYITVANSEHREHEWKWVEIGILSNHLSSEYARFLGFNGRLRRAWKALRGEIHTDFEFIDQFELERFIATLQSACAEAFGDPHPTFFGANATNTPSEITLPLGNAETVTEP